MKKYNEILKLKEMLEKAEIPFIFVDPMFEDVHQRPSHQIVINNEKGDKTCDAIQHFGSYGEESDLIEIMGGLTNEEREDNSVLGYLTADEVFKRFKYCHEHQTSTYIMESK